MSFFGSLLCFQSPPFISISPHRFCMADSMELLIATNGRWDQNTRKLQEVKNCNTLYNGRKHCTVMGVGHVT